MGIRADSAKANAFDAISLSLSVLFHLCSILLLGFFVVVMQKTSVYFHDEGGHCAGTYLQLPLQQWGAGNVYPFSVVQLKGKHCRKPHCRNGVVDTFGLCRSK